MSKKYHIITYGCQMNKSDTGRISGILKESGCLQSTLKKADFIIVNMCSVRQSAVDRVHGLIPKFEKLKAKTVLTGCVLDKNKKKFKKKFDIVLDIKNLSTLPGKLNLPQKNKKKDYLKINPQYDSKISSNIPVIIGCNNFCSYCAVPYTRGREISRPAIDILCEVKTLIKRGFKEIWLLGENVNSYKHKNYNFSKLLKEINSIPSDFWIRFTSPHPKDLSDELIEAMRKSKKWGHYLNLPLQSGDNEILKKMKRPYTKKQYENIAKKVKKEIPDIVLSTDVILGFPGETEKQFQKTCEIFKKIKFDMAYISKYSPRPGTEAEKMEDNVSSKEKKRREKVLTEILKRTSLENNKKYVNKTLTVLPEKKRKEFLFGKSKEYKTVKFKGEKNLIGEFVKVKIIRPLPWGLKGEMK